MDTQRRLPYVSMGGASTNHQRHSETRRVTTTPIAHKLNRSVRNNDNTTTNKNNNTTGISHNDSSNSEKTKPKVRNLVHHFDSMRVTRNGKHRSDLHTRDTNNHVASVVKASPPIISAVTFEDISPVTGDVIFKPSEELIRDKFHNKDKNKKIQFTPQLSNENDSYSQHFDNADEIGGHHNRVSSTLPIRASWNGDSSLGENDVFKSLTSTKTPTPIKRQKAPQPPPQPSHPAQTPTIDLVDTQPTRPKTLAVLVSGGEDDISNDTPKSQQSPKSILKTKETSPSPETNRKGIHLCRETPKHETNTIATQREIASSQATHSVDSSSAGDHISGVHRQKSPEILRTKRGRTLSSSKYDSSISSSPSVGRKSVRFEAVVSCIY